MHGILNLPSKDFVGGKDKIEPKHAARFGKSVFDDGKEVCHVVTQNLQQNMLQLL